MTPPTLSVVLPNYNHADFLSESLSAILHQSYRPQEVIVIDDASTDESVALLEATAKRDSIVRVFRNEVNRGVHYSLNRGLEIARGTHVYSASADDRVLPGFFEQSIELLTQYPRAGLCSALTAIIGADGKHQGLSHTAIVSRTACFLSPETTLTMLRRHGAWFNGTTAIRRRDELVANGGFVSDLGPYADAFQDLVLALKHGACFIPEPLAVWRKTTGAYSRAANRDLDVMLNIMQKAKHLMQTTHRDLFPADYVDQWEGVWLADTGAHFTQLSHEAQLAGLRRVLPSTTPLDTAFLSGLRMSMIADHLMAKLYLFSRFKRSHGWQVIARKLRHLLDPRIPRQVKRKMAGRHVELSNE